MRYPHHVVIKAPPAGAPTEEDPEAGVYNEAPSEVIYDGRGDVQDVGAEVVYRQDNVSKRSEAVLFLASEAAIAAIRTGMSVLVVWNPDAEIEQEEGADPWTGYDTDDAEVENVTRLDGTVGLRFL